MELPPNNPESDASLPIPASFEFQNGQVEDRRPDRCERVCADRVEDRDGARFIRGPFPGGGTKTGRHPRRRCVLRAAMGDAAGGAPDLLAFGPRTGGFRGIRSTTVLPDGFGIAQVRGASLVWCCECRVPVVVLVVELVPVETK